MPIPFEAPSKSQPQTRSGELREILEEEIATGRLPPGRRLDETELSQRFNVSRTPIREALIQLASVGIIEARPRRGAIIPQLTPQRMIEMFEVMAELESMCGRLAARRMSEPDHEALVRAHDACDAVRSNPDEYYYRNEDFHYLICVGSHNSFLAEQASALRRRLRPYRRLQLRVRDRINNSYSEHQEIVDAILAGEAERTADLMWKHVLVQGERFTDLMASLSRLKYLDEASA
jgi:DNA-binding GntR family transcriptional regulator